MNPRLRHWFREYAAFHRHPTNQLTHKIAIPAIVFHVLAMLDWIHLISLDTLFGTSIDTHVSLGHVFFLGVVAWYFTLSPKLASIAFVACLPLFALGALTPAWLVVTIALIAWTVQLAGHLVWENRSPAFFTNLLQALIGPLFVIAVYTGDWKAALEP